MRPSREQIEVAAYLRWVRRGFGHGLDREDWAAAEKDLVFAHNYRYVARHKLAGEPDLLGKEEADSARRRRRCRFCELSEPSTSFDLTPLALPALVGNSALVGWDECDECRALYDGHLAGAFESFARPLLGSPPALPREGAGIPAQALKALVRMALSVMPASELHHFGDTIEWVSNPEHTRDAGLLGDLGCHVYVTPAPVPAPFIALARRAESNAPVPYMLVFLGTSRVVFQTHLPLSSRDEELEETGIRGPELSMSMGDGQGFRASLCSYLAVEPQPSLATTRPD